MSVAKFLSMLSSASIAFPQLKLLASRDPKEGRYTSLNHAFSKQIEVDDEMASLIAKQHPHLDEENALKVVRLAYGPMTLSGTEDMNQHCHYINCWNSSPFEPAQLWSAYASESEGVAIKSNLDRLSDAFLRSNENIYIGAINYVDFESTPIQVGNAFTAIYSKRIEFSHEAECRLSIVNYPKDVSDLANTEILEKNPSVLLAKCDLNMLIDEIVVAPFAEDWQFTTIEQIAKRFGLQCKISRSVLNS